MNQRFFLPSLLAIGLFCISLANTLSGQTTQTSALTWRWQDQTGTWHQPWSDSQTIAVVGIFVTVDCPIANAFQPEIARIAESYRNRGVSLFLFYPELSSDDPRLVQHRRDFKINIPSIADPELEWVKRFDAAVTPQAVVFTRDSTEPAYSGRIDNRFANYGKRRPQPTERDLIQALDEIVAGQPVTTSRTEAIGCQIERSSPVAWTLPANPGDRSTAAGQPKAPNGQDDRYQPAEPTGKKAEQLELEFVDKKRDRKIPLRVYLPKQTEAAPVVLFSHGLGGNRNGSTFLGNHWAEQGYVTVVMQHPGSDESVWRDAPVRERMAAMSKAANGENLLLRIADVPAVIDQLTQWNKQQDHPLLGRLDLERLGMSGHSFGAVTTQAVSGQKAMGRPLGTDPRIKAALVLSPSSPRAGQPASAFGSVKLPWMLMTGTDDLSPIGDIDMESRLAVFPALPTGDKFELVLNGAQHSVFNDRDLMPRSQPNKPAHHKTILKLSTAFWDAYLRDDKSAKDWLQSDGPQSVMDKKDRWQIK
jgi:predicted dienelactone hydrolase